MSTTETVVLKTTAASSSSAVVLALFGFTIFCSAFLLFQIQLVITKYILPWFGGTPATFTTSILFFQCFLLLGYSYAHIVTVKISPRAQAVVHSALILIAVIFLAFRFAKWGSPLLPDATWKPSDGERPFLRILALLLASVALPYFMVSTTGPLLQAWYGRICRGTPYRLYALSNAGSLIALLSYPILIEPLLPLRMQAHVWAIGFLLFGTGCVAIAWTAAQSSPNLPELEPRAELVYEEPTTRGRKVMWTLLAAAGSLSLLATTNRVCQDIAVVPLLWVLPLSLYLLSFILCFSSEGWYSRKVWSVALGMATLLVCFALYQPDTNIFAQILIYSFALFACCMVCHGELVRLKPPKEELTSFYFYVSAGGALGGFFVSIIAPLIFKGFWEFHLSIWLCCVLFGFVLLNDRASWAYIPKPILLVFSALLIVSGPGLLSVAHNPTRVVVLLLVVSALIAFMWSGHSGHASPEQQRRAATFTVAFAGLALGLLVAYPPYVSYKGAIQSGRNFYGAEAVIRDTYEGFPRRVLRHGNITHGFQYSQDSKRRIPTSYFTPQSGIGLVLTNFPGRAVGNPLRIGIIGLGVGTIAAYGQPGDNIRFYEINPAVINMDSAGPQQLFTFLTDSRANISVIPGDARISLERELRQNQIGNFDVFVIDAFSGDAIPVHLLTREAFHLYLQHLSKPNGILIFHVSNNAIDLRPVVSRLAAESDMSAWLVQSDPPYASAWIVVSRLDRQSPIPGVDHMTRIMPTARYPRWTDDYSNVLQVLRW